MRRISKVQRDSMDVRRSASTYYRMTLFQSTSYPAASSSRANVCFQPPLMSKGSSMTPSRSRGNFEVAHFEGARSPATRNSR